MDVAPPLGEGATPVVPTGLFVCPPNRCGEA